MTTESKTLSWLIVMVLALCLALWLLRKRTFAEVVIRVSDPNFPDIDGGLLKDESPPRVPLSKLGTGKE